MHGLLVGALVVDTTSAAAPARDRIFVMTMAPESIAANPAGTGGFVTFAINGRSWPHTERIAATVGDTTHWRIINASNDVHPLHLHGFYYRVDASSGTGPGAPGRMVVTERMLPFSTMSMTWVPERAGNWLFHCHFQLHLVPDSVAPMHDEDNHALTGMAGLVVGVNVAPKRGAIATPAPARGRRQLRLVAIQDAGFPDSAPSMRFVLEEPGGATPRLEARPGFSPTITLTRDEPVSITVVNRLHERTAVHWHGIELESYYDGVGGFSGAANRLAPTIAPGDSFEARFTPPRSGTFMYHSHVNEVRQHPAGLAGPLIVRDSPAAPTSDDLTFFIKGAREGRGAPSPLEVNGMPNPDTVVLHAGKAARLRFIGLPMVNPNATVWLTSRRDSSYANLRDTLVLSWRPIAKDGADTPESGRTARLARQVVSMGETYDFEFTPSERGQLRIEVRTGGRQGRLLVRVPIRVD
jgi:FtsP/CotA-like multicopper oxidase with cupredoxin domain